MEGVCCFLEMVLDALLDLFEGCKAFGPDGGVGAVGVAWEEGQNEEPDGSFFPCFDGVSADGSDLWEQGVCGAFGFVP